MHQLCDAVLQHYVQISRNCGTRGMNLQSKIVCGEGWGFHVSLHLLWASFNLMLCTEHT